jgi:hypothetical protein
VRRKTFTKNGDNKVTEPTVAGSIRHRFHSLIAGKSPQNRFETCPIV